jgi:hypothetical protein
VPAEDDDRMTEPSAIRALLLKAPPYRSPHAVQADRRSGKSDRRRVTLV